MSKISRSIYQKCKEENKRLLNDIELLVMLDDFKKSHECYFKWYNHFEKEREFNTLMKQVAREYIINHKDELPNFLTDLINENN